ncbi:MAG: LysM peptidoglycan-binding domain-containing protein [Rhodospirillales bacterium]|nr:LysM peptidoglycan-binding domain-containing protein [Rhodospirillales bacterium]
MNRNIVIGVVVLVLAVLVGVFFMTRGPGDEETVAAGQEGSAATQQAAVAPQETPAAEAPAGEEVAPSFDVVRVEPSGETIMAGRAAPGSEVTVMDGDEALGTVTADEAGEWVFLPEKPLDPGAHELGLVAKAPSGGETTAAAPAATEVPEAAKTAAGTAAETAAQPEAAPAGAPAETAIEAPTETQVAAVPEPLTEPEGAQSENVVVVVVPEQPEAEVTVAGEPAPEPEQPIAMLTPRAGEGGSKVLQQPGEPGLIDRDLVLNAVDYDDAGRVVISGQAPPGATIVVYLNNQLIGRVVADAEGLWRLVPATRVPPGLHTLRVDRVDGSGKVVARVETPFSRATVLTSLGDEEFVVVQPGNSLWRIARRSYGQGVRYTVIYQANAAQIRDPDLIYPGQIFVVPPSN